MQSIVSFSLLFVCARWINVGCLPVVGIFCTPVTTTCAANPDTPANGAKVVSITFYPSVVKVCFPANGEFLNAHFLLNL